MTHASRVEPERDPEGERLERKASWAEAAEIRRTICAFANDLAGDGQPKYLAVGLTDHGSPSGATIDDKLMNSLANLATENNFAPSPSFDVSMVSGAVPYVLLTVHPHPYPPMRFNGRVYVRIGPTTRQASAQEEKRLAERRRHVVTPFDQSPLGDAGLPDLRIEALQREYFPEAIDPEILAQNGRVLGDQLRGLRLVDADDRPVVGALLAYGVDSGRWIPGSYVQFVRFDGIADTDAIVDQKRIVGTLAEILTSLDDLLRINVRSALSIADATTDIRRSDYPIRALQQIVRNALMHRQYDPGITNAPVRVYWYSDRVEISNPGGLFGQVNESNFGTGVVDYRNPLVSEILATLGYVQRFGMGVSIIREALESNGNPPAEFAFAAHHVLVTLRRVE